MYMGARYRANSQKIRTAKDNLRLSCANGRNDDVSRIYASGAAVASRREGEFPDVSFERTGHIAPDIVRSFRPY